MGSIRKREFEKKMKETRSKSIVLNTKEVGDRKRFRKNVESVRKQTRKDTGGMQSELKRNRKETNHLVRSDSNRKDLERILSMNGSSSGEDSMRTVYKRQKQMNHILDTVKKRSFVELGKEDRLKKAEKAVTEWKEQVVRVGTGFRVRKDEKDPKRRRFDVGFADMKSYKRKDGREAVIDSSNMGRTVTGKCVDARVKVINAVSAMEKRRRVSKYTGSGILRKSLVGKLKLKSTKAGGK